MRSILSIAFGVLLPLAPVTAQGNGCPNPTTGPDVIVGSLPNIQKFGTVNGVTGYSVATTSCNVGDEILIWVANNNQHPVIGQNLFRVEDGRIEQIGQSWLKHGFTALQQSLCCGCIAHPNGTFLGVGCSDPYSASLNGSQQRLGPRWQVNAFTGEFAYPYAQQGQTGNAVFKRLQVANTDLDPNLHPDATYFCEGHYVAPDDSAAGNQFNNASYRRTQVGNFTGGGYNLTATGPTVRELPAIFAWREVYPNVQIRSAEPDGDGRFWIGSNVTEVSTGVWRYDYAVQNLCSDRSAGSFTVPFLAGSTPTDIHFRDVEYHSGEPYDGTDWTVDVGTDSITWSTIPHSVNPDANAIRWGTLYSFGFTINAGPEQGTATLGLFKPGVGDSVTTDIIFPGDDCIPGNTSYCTAGANSVSPTGAAIDFFGSTSVGQNDFTLVAFDAVPGQTGLFFYGPASTSTPFGDGTLCVTGQTIRINPPGQIDFFGQMIRDLDLSNPPTPAGLITEGSTWFFQFWYRDPAAGGAGFNLSNGLEVSFCQ